MSDYIVRATAANDCIRCFAIDSRELTETTRKLHDTWPVATAALGRLLSAGAMMGIMMKGEEDKMTLQIQCSGPIGGLTVTADSHGRVKGFVNEPHVDLPLKENGHLDVGKALDLGVLSVIRDLGLREPYVGDCELKTGEIGDDLTYYFAASEQIPSSVGLGVLVNPDGSVRQAGGFIVQLMPDTPDEVIDQLEQSLTTMPSVTELLEMGMTPEDILRTILNGFDVEINETVPAEFYCGCSKEHVAGAIATLSKQDLTQLIEDGEDIEVKCHFCGTAYKFSPEELKELRDR